GCPAVGRSLVGASGGSRTHLVPLKRRARGRCVTLARRLAVGPGFEPGSFPLTAGRVTSYHHPTTPRRRLADRRGFEPRTAGSEPAVLPLDDLSNGGIGRTRTSTDLRPRQVGYRLPNDPNGVTARIRTGTRRSTVSCAALTPRPPLQRASSARVRTADESGSR